MNWSLDEVALVPTDVVTVTFTVPLVPGVENTYKMLSDTTEKNGVALVPKLTEVAPVKPEPCTSTTAPPDCEPLFGEIEVTTGKVLADAIGDASSPGTAVVAKVKTPDIAAVLTTLAIALTKRFPIT